MSASPFRKGLPWLVASTTLFLTSLVAFLIDASQSDQRLIQGMEENLQKALHENIRAFSSDTISPPRGAGNIPVAKLVFDPTQRLETWDQTPLLPRQRLIDRLSNIPEENLIQLGNRSYYQIRKFYQDSTVVFLLPLYVQYEVDNKFLRPYLVLGKWNQLFSTDQAKSIRVQVGDAPSNADADIRLYDLKGDLLLSYAKIPVSSLRARTRYAVVILLFLALIGMVFFLRIYALRRWKRRYVINAWLLGGISGLRFLLYVFEFPAEYLDSPLFRPDVLAFSSLAPSLGEMSLNILTLVAVVWVLYTYVFRLSNLFYRRVMNESWAVWPLMILFIVISSLLMKWFVDTFIQIINNSQVDIEFTNVFKTDFYSFLILLDVGLLLLAIGLIAMTLLKLNMLYGRRHRWPIQFLLINGGTLFLTNLLIHPSAPFLAIIVSLVLIVLIVVIYRVPFRPILHHDLANYLLMTLGFSVLVTYNIVIGINFKNQQKAQRIADRVLRSRSAATVSAYTKSMKTVEREILQIREKRRELPEVNDFRDWLEEQYFRPNLKEFETTLFVYDTADVRQDEHREKQPVFGPEIGVPLERRGESVSEEYLFRQMPNRDNQYNEVYVGRFDLVLGNDSADYTRFLLELFPTSQETEGLYPSLTLDQRVYDEIKLINSFDHAVYRQGLLNNDWGRSAFPVYMEDYDKIEGKTNRVRGEYLEYLEPIGANKLVVVRFPQISLFETITTFSFIFYFFSLATLVFLGLPVLGLRSLRSRQFVYDIPLRAKIRFGLLAISILPMIVIIVLLYPFVSSRYEQEARDQLSEETARIATLVQPHYWSLRNDPFSRLTLQRDFQDEILELAKYVQNDINVYDQQGKFIASTQPMVFDMGISTDLMDARALKILKREGTSDLMIQEQTGNLEYLSGYRAIIGSGKDPIGFINVPYIARQDQLQDQIINFLAYLANIYLLVFLLLNVIAVLVSNTITKPLTVVQQRLADTSLGNINEPIKYNSKDEIGDIVKAYNQMVEKLAESEKKITQNERELAWRQMARQVAHEIKNPLTPMRLSIQHLSRAWGEQSARLEKMFPKVMKTLLVQIDSLVRIANSFSEFAKMPEPVKTKVNVNDVLLEVVDLYAQMEETIWLIDVPKEAFWAYGDRDQLSRCFNNIIKNGLQAIEENGILHISMRILEQRTRIEIKDNGKGMSEEVQRRVFEPSFSTKTSGMGLGLAIVKRIIENSGGTIFFRSKEGEGTTFIIEIPSLEVESLQPAPVGQ